MLANLRRRENNPTVHIPDGFLDARTCVGTLCLAGAGVAVASRRLAARWSDRTIPLLGVMSAFVFAGQMVNFPVLGGTSGHLLGGVLAATLLGPAAATMALTIVLIVQCFLFQDGGLTALGANVLNLALVGVGGGYGVSQCLRRLLPGRPGQLAAIAIASWFSTVLAATACACELALAGAAPLRMVLPAMTLTHAVIGVGEAVITVSVVAFVLKVRSDLVFDPAARPASAPERSWKFVVLCGLTGSLGVAVLLAPLASPLPDGLEQLAQQLGFAERATTTVAAPLANYSLPGSGVGGFSTVGAAVLGTLLAGAIAWAVATALPRTRNRPRPRSD